MRSLLISESLDPETLANPVKNPRDGQLSFSQVGNGVVIKVVLHSFLITNVVGKLYLLHRLPGVMD